ncbi:MAG: UrcA family protein [Rhizomicrobium sp.]
MIRPLASAALALALCATAIQAQPRQTSVSLAGLNLSSLADARTLDSRIHDAAVQVCGPAGYQPGQGIAQFMEARETAAACVRQAEAAARLQLAGLRKTPAPYSVAASGN